MLFQDLKLVFFDFLFEVVKEFFCPFFDSFFEFAVFDGFLEVFKALVCLAVNIFRRAFSF